IPNSLGALSPDDKSDKSYKWYRLGYCKRTKREDERCARRRCVAGSSTPPTPPVPNFWEFRVATAEGRSVQPMLCETSRTNPEWQQLSKFVPPARKLYRVANLSRYRIQNRRNGSTSPNSHQLSRVFPPA